jgi:AcrR family transcriptional regulator
MIRVSPRKTPQQSRSQVTVDAILQAAARILTVHGTSGFNTNAVAALAGVSVGSLYQYFPGKDAILVEINRRHALETAQPIMALLQQEPRPSLQQMVRSVVQAFVGCHVSQIELHKVMSREAHLWGDQAWRAQHKQAVGQAMRTCLAAYADQVSMPLQELNLFLMLNLVESSVHQALHEAPQSLVSGALAKELELLLLAYLQAKRPAHSARPATV